MLVGEFWRRVWYRLHRNRFERELQDEMAVHREALPDARDFGNTLRLREESRDAWGWAAIDRLEEDIRAACRLVRGAPLFSLTAALILGAGIGLNLTFFHVLNVTTLRPPAVTDPASLVRFSRETSTFFASGFPFPSAAVIREHNDVLSALLARHRGDVLWDQAPSEPVKASFVSANWFDEMGYRATLGRFLAEGIDTATDAPLTVVIGHHFHRVRLQSDPAVIGRQLRLNERLVTVIGVAPPAFPDFDLDDTQLWLPIEHVDRLNPGSTLKTDWRSVETELYARLKPGVSAEAATDGLRPAAIALARRQPKTFKPDERFVGTTARDGFNSSGKRHQIVMTAALVGALALIVLVVTSANLANFVLSHAIGRLREFSIRTALGATRARILRQMLVECALLVAAGTVIGVVLSWTLAQVIAARAELPAYFDFTPDAALLVAATAVAAVAMLPVGVLPAWMIGRRNLAHVMRDGGQQVSAGLAKARFRMGLVAVQVVGCCALLLVAGAIYGGLRHRLQTDPGFRVDRAVLLDVSLTRHGISDAQARNYWMGVTEQLSAHPLIERVALASPAPLSGAMTSSSYPEPEGLRATKTQVSPQFFDTMEIPLVAGRTFAPDDDDSVVIISRKLALRVYGSTDVIGKPYPSKRSDRRVIGVAGDAALLPARSGMAGDEYMPLKTRAYSEAVLVARSRGEPAAIVDALRSAARQADARVLPRTVMLAPAYEARFRMPRMARLVSGMVAGLVLALACFGIAGVVAYAVKVRTKELGIRRALGASASRVCSTLLLQLAVPVGLGVLAGSAVGVKASDVLSRDPFNLAVGDAAISTLAIGLFVVSALASALAAASRALYIDPLRALRHE